MSENKTQPTEESVDNFINAITDDKRREDSREMVRILQQATGATPVLWGSIVGFGTHHYKYESGREGDTVAVGFSPRKQALVVYGVSYQNDASAIARLGAVETGKSCIYIKDLDKVDQQVLHQMVAEAYDKNNNVS